MRACVRVSVCVSVHGIMMSWATLQVWDVAQSFKCVKTLAGHESTILALCHHG